MLGDFCWSTIIILVCIEGFSKCLKWSFFCRILIELWYIDSRQTDNTKSVKVIHLSFMKGNSYLIPQLNLIPVAGKMYVKDILEGNEEY